MSGFAELRERFGKYFDVIPDVDAWVKEQRGGNDEEIKELRFIVSAYRTEVMTADAKINTERHRADVAEQELHRLSTRVGGLEYRLAFVMEQIAKMQAAENELRSADAAAVVDELYKALSIYRSEQPQ